MVRVTVRVEIHCRFAQTYPLWCTNRADWVGHPWGNGGHARSPKMGDVGGLVYGGGLDHGRARGFGATLVECMPTPLCLCPDPPWTPLCTTPSAPAPLPTHLQALLASYPPFLMIPGLMFSSFLVSSPQGLRRSVVLGATLGAVATLVCGTPVPL